MPIVENEVSKKSDEAKVKSPVESQPEFGTGKPDAPSNPMILPKTEVKSKSAALQSLEKKTNEIAMTVDTKLTSITPDPSKMALSAQERAHLKRTQGAVLGTDKASSMKPISNTREGIELLKKRGLLQTVPVPVAP